MKFKNKIHRKDCITGMQQLPDGCVDLAFADPPFNIGYDYDEYDDRKAADEYLNWSHKWIAEVVRVLKADGTFWLAIGDEYAAELKVQMTREHALTCRSWVIWYYTFGVNCKHKFSRSHAHLFYMVKDRERFTFNADDPQVRVPSARQLVYADKRANPQGRLPDDTWIAAPRVESPESRVESQRPGESGASATGVHHSPLTTHHSPTLNIPRASLLHEGWVLRPQDVPAAFGASEDVWYFPRVNGTFKERAGWHGCQMPEQLLARIIRACSREGELVLDPFCGSGTTPAVAKKLGRQYVTFEMSKDYAARATERLAAIKSGDPLDGVADPLTSVAPTANGRRREDLAPPPANPKRGKRVDGKQPELW
jgi:site-specific DNA-methyltransferase (adenine-specific)